MLIARALDSPHYLSLFHPQSPCIMSHSEHDTTTSSTTTTANMTMMVPYLHFTGGDYLFFDVWQPQSLGALTGVCIGLVVLALFERWLAATRVTFALYWQNRSISLVNLSLWGRSYILCRFQGCCTDRCSRSSGDETQDCEYGPGDGQALTCKA